MKSFNFCVFRKRYAVRGVIFKKELVKVWVIKLLFDTYWLYFSFGILGLVVQKPINANP